MLIYWCSFSWTIVTLCSDEVFKIKTTLSLIDHIYSSYKLNRKRYFIGGYTSNWSRRRKDRNSSQHSDPFHKFFNAQKFAGIHLFFTCDPRKPCKFFSCKQYCKIRPVPWRLSCVDRAKSILKRK